SGTDNMQEKLKIAVSMDTLEYLKLVALSLEFEAYNQNIKVELDPRDKAEAYDYYKRAAQMGDAPDIMLLDNAWVNEFAALGYVTQLDEVWTSNMNEVQIAPMVSQVKWNGLLWAVPKEVDPYVLVWHKERLASHDLIEPPVTIEAFVDLNRTLTDTEEEL